MSTEPSRQNGTPAVTCAQAANDGENAVTKDAATQVDPADVERFIAQPRFHYKFAYHSSIAKKEIVASYSIAGKQDPDAATFVYIGGVFGGRFHAMFVDYLCVKKGVRGIFPDRPGLGSFTAVPMEQRTEVFLEAIPKIFEHAGVKQKVVLMALSGGVPYALNFLWYRPDLFSNDVYFISPWIHPSKSGVRFHYWASMLPAYMTRSMGKFAVFMLKTLIARIPKDGSNRKFVKAIPDLETKIQETCGGDADEIERRRQAYINALFTEDVSGSAEDYLLGVKDPTHTWGVAASYEEYAKMLSEKCRKDGTRLKLHGIFAANDTFVGNQGIQYFCDVFGSTVAKEGFDFESGIVENSNHEAVALPEMGIIGKLMDEYQSKSDGVSEGKE